MNQSVIDMNGTVWIFAIMLISMVVIQATIFVRHALRFNGKHALVSKQELASATRTGFISVVGPAISVIVVALSLIAVIGPAATFMRCGVIGAPSWELLMANTSVATVGVAFNTPEFTHSVFTLAIFGMTFASAPYFINTILTLKPLDLAVAKSLTVSADEKQKESFLPHLGSAAMMGIMGYSLVDHLKTIPGVVALVVAAIVSIIVMNVIKKTGIKWLSDWNMAFSMVTGMAAAQIAATLIA